MRRAIKALVMCGVLAAVSAPIQARAEGYVSPFAGVTFGNDSIGNHGMYGVNAGWMGAGIIGGEVDFGYAPKFFGSDFDNHVFDVMGNVIIGIPIGGTRGAGLRPYVTGGVGVVQVQIEPGITSVGEYKTNNFAFDLGAGVMGYFSDHVGLRGDVRYFRNVNDNDSVNPFDFSLAGFDFWRASIGLVIR
jgi:opacity protein-like surface antigen